MPYTVKTTIGGGRSRMPEQFATKDEAIKRAKTIAGEYGQNEAIVEVWLDHSVVLSK